MIGYLKGTLLHAGEDSIIVEAGGVGFEVHPTLGVLSDGPVPGDAIELFISTLFREEEIRLFGFASLRERNLFELLMTVSGVGPRNALLIVSQLGEEALVEAVLAGNPMPLTRIKGIGNRTAERILLELKTRISKLFGGPAPAGRLAAAGMSSNLLEAVEALVGLGFRRSEALAAVQASKGRKDAQVDELLKEALAKLRGRERR